MVKRIAFDARYVNDRYHGIGRYAFRLIEALAQTAPQYTFVVLRGAAPDSRFNWDALGALPNVVLQQGPASLYWPHEQLIWPFVLRRLGVDLFHSPYFVAPLLSSVPAIVTVHDLIFERYPEYMPQSYTRPYYRLLMALSTRRAKRVVAVSQATARDLQHFYRISRDKIAVCGEAADPALAPLCDKAERRRLRCHYNLARPFVLAVGARRPHKNFQRLVEAFALIEPHFEHDLVFVGPADERFPDEARRTAQNLQLQERVRFLGWAPEADLPGLYSLAQAVAAPSLIEGFGLPVLEAMACGAPVLANDAAALPEVAGEAALLVDATDSLALALALRHLLSDASLRQWLSEAGLRRAASFTWPGVAEKILQVYEEILT